MTRGFASCLVLTIATGLAFAMTCSTTEARPLYLKQFIVKYPNLENAAKTAKCDFCHAPGQNKKNARLDYGKAIEANIGMKNQKNIMAIDAALGRAEQALGKNNQTFGEMIKAGKLPE